MKDIETYESHDQAHIEFSELYRDPWREDKQLKQLYQTDMHQIKIKTFKGVEQGPTNIISIADKAALNVFILI